MAERQSKYKLFSAILNLSLSDQIEFDITANVAEVNLYEHLEKPYITATLALLDDFSMRERLQITGSERIYLEFRSTQQDGSAPVIKNFFISKILDVKRTSDRTEMISIELVEDQFWINSVKQISKSYKGKLDDIIGQIVTDNFSPKKCVKKNFTGTAQGQRKLIVPYMNPLSAVQWIKTRATTIIGSPIYVYSTLYQNDLYISDLDGLMLKDPVNRKPLYYGEALMHLDVFKDVARPYIEILNYREHVSQNTLDLYEQGGVGSLFSMTDAGTGISDETHVSIRNVIDDLNYNGVLKSRHLQNIYDERVKIDDKYTDQYNSVNTFQITSGKTYNQYANFHDETDETFSRLKSRNRIIRLALKKDNMDIMMDGSPWFESQVSVGAKLRILFLNSNTKAEKENISDQIDYKKSGDYMVLAAHHTLIEDRHRVTATLTKLENLSENFEINE